MGCSSAYIILFVVLFTFLVDVAAAPISPSAADTERIAERMRAEGLSERFKGRNCRFLAQLLQQTLNKSSAT